jgi:signal transduction histidine kinase
MTATQVLAPVGVAENVRTVLSACRRQRSATDYARQLIQTLAETTHSQHALWLNLPAGPGYLVAETDGFDPFTRRLMLERRLPLLDNAWTFGEEIHSVAAVAIRFRSSVVGILAVANGARPYTPADIVLLETIGRIAVAEHEALERTETLGVENRQESMADLVHGLRQPLGILEACAFLLDMSLPAGETRAREHLTEMLSQLERASGILDQSTTGYASRPRTDETEPEESDSRFFANSAMSMVT